MNGNRFLTLNKKAWEQEMTPKWDWTHTFTLVNMIVQLILIWTLWNH